MIHVFDIAFKDLLQLVRDRKTFLFLLIMPVVFTLLFGYAFGGFSGEASDPRLPVGFVNADQSWLSDELHRLLGASQVIRLESYPDRLLTDLEAAVAEGELAGAVILPAGYGKAMLSGKPAQVTLIIDQASTAATTVKAEILAQANRLDSAAHTAIVLERVAGERIPFDYAFEQSLSAWQDPPIAVAETTSTAISQENDRAGLAHTSPGMMLQFAIASLLTSAQVLVNERKSRSLQRLLTTRVRRAHILAGHYLAILTLIFAQFLTLILFAQLVLEVDYLRDPTATLLVAITAALCIAAMGLLIGVLAKNEDQAVIFSLVPMFLFAGLGGAWVPLEVTGEAFRTIGHLSPVAWGMDGFKNITIRGLGIESVLLPALALAGYAVLFLILAIWRLQVSEEH
jgi:ABC-2 type transport system permease protein